MVLYNRKNTLYNSSCCIISVLYVKCYFLFATTNVFLILKQAASWSHQLYTLHQTSKTLTWRRYMQENETFKRQTHLIDLFCLLFFLNSYFFCQCWYFADLSRISISENFLLNKDKTKTKLSNSLRFILHQLCKPLQLVQKTNGCKMTPFGCSGKVLFPSSVTIYINTNIKI